MEEEELPPEEIEIFMCIGCHTYPGNQIDNFSGYERRHPELSMAWEKLFEGEFSRVEEIIAQPLEDNDPEAIFISSAFSRKGESEEDFHRRNVRSIEIAADLGFPVALYAIGYFYDTGQFVKKDLSKAAEYFKKAAEKGHAHSMWIHGQGLLYGQHVYNDVMDEKLGLEYIRRAAELKFEPAIEVLIKFCENGKFGYSTETEIYQKLKADLKSDDLLTL